MKPLKCLVCVVVIVAVLVGSALGNEEGGVGNEVGGVGNEEGGDIDNPVTEVGECRIETGRQTKLKVLDELTRVISRCVEQSNISVSLLRFVDNIQGARLFAGHFCERIPSFKQCLTEVSKNWAGCYNETLNNLYSIFEDVIETSSNEGCLNEGENLATILVGFKRHTEKKKDMNDVVRECIIFGGRRWVLAQRSDADVATKILITHREMKVFMDCLKENIHEDETFLSVTEGLLNETINKMKCIHPTEGGLVLCNTIDDSLIDRESACPLKTGDSSFPLSLILEGKTTICLIQSEPYTPMLSDATTIEEFRKYFRNYCRRQGRVQHCINETTQAAGICLHDAQFKEYNLVRGYLNNLLNAACFEDGRRVATMFHAAKALRNTTEEKDALLTCLATIQSARNQQTYDMSTRLYQYYQELSITRKCVLDNIPGDGTFIEDVNSFVDEMMKKMKCKNPQDGSTVFCQTLDSN